jgi:retinol dehydrogenase-12
MKFLLPLCSSITLIIAVSIGIIWKTCMVNPLTRPTTPMKGKIVIVTGSTKGSIGWETAKQLAELGAVVHLPFRDSKKSIEAKQAILHAVPNAQVYTYDGVNFEDLNSVRKFAREQFTGPLDVLVNNAGMAKIEVEPTKADKIESVFQVNHLAPLLLTVELIPALKQRKHSRVVFVSSTMHYLGKVEMGNNSPYSAESRGLNHSRFDRYSDTKLLNVLAAKGIDAKFSKYGIRSNSLNPGFVWSQLDQHITWPMNIIVSRFRRMVARNTDEGAYTSVTLASDPALENVGGQFFSDHCINDLCKSCLLCNSANTDGGGIGVKVFPSTNDITLREFVWNEASKLVGPFNT